MKIKTIVTIAVIISMLAYLSFVGVEIELSPKHIIDLEKTSGNLCTQDSTIYIVYPTGFTKTLTGEIIYQPKEKVAVGETGELYPRAVTNVSLYRVSLLPPRSLWGGGE